MSPSAGGQPSLRLEKEAEANSKENFLPQASEKERSAGLARKGPRSARGPPQPPPAPAGVAEQSTHSSKLCGTAFRVYLDILLLSRGRGGHARGGASGPGPPAGSGPAPSRHLPTPSRPVA